MENDTWAQTLVTITPEEDGYLREIADTTVVSAQEPTPLNLDTEDISYRETLRKITRDFVDPRELEKAEFQDTEVQTYMRGIPKVQFVISHKDEASQTLYIGRNCPPIPGQTPKAIVNVLNKRALPKLKKSQLAQTIITVLDDLPQEQVLKGLLQEVTDQEQGDPELMIKATEDESIKIETLDLINYLIDRTLWIVDPTPDVAISTQDVEIETTIMYNHHLKRFMVDDGVQTSMSLEPTKSNSKLLDHYLEVKGLVQNLLDQTMDIGVYPRIFIDDLVNEIINKCSEFTHWPLKDEAVQTLASGRPFDAKDDEVLKNLRRSVLADPVQTLMMVSPIVDEMLDTVADTVSADAEDSANFVVNKLVQKTLVIGKKLDDIQRSSRGPPIDRVLSIRKRKLAVLMPRKKEMEDASTQTGLAGVPSLRKYQEHKEVACCVCPTQSECRWCLAGDEELPKENKLLTTQDILLAYKPCYVIMDPAEATPDMKRPCLEAQHSAIPENVSRRTSSGSYGSYRECPCVPLQEKSEVAESTSGWSQVIATALTDAWIFPKTPSRESRSTISTRQSQTTCKCSTSKIPVPKASIEALQIFQSTFCSRDTCPGSSKMMETTQLMHQQSVQKFSQTNNLEICTNYTPPGSDDCICTFFKDKIEDRLRALSNPLQKNKQ